MKIPQRLAKVLAGATLLLLGAAPLCAQFKVIGYFPSWAGAVSDIQFTKLTHVNYSFLLPTASGGLQAIENPSKLQSLVSSAHSNGVKVYIAVGGWNDGNDSAFETLAGSSTGRTNFVNSIINFVNQYNLDGVDIDWEYPDPGTSGSNYTLLMQQLSSALHSRGKGLSAAVVAQGSTGGGISSTVFGYVDHLNIMAYDANEYQHSTYSYAQSSLSYWLGRGLPKSKAILGVPFYGRPSWESFAQLIARGASPTADTFNGVGYNGITTIKSKTNLAYDQGGGIMFWELSQDAKGANSLVTAINQVVVQRQGGGGGGGGSNVKLSVPGGSVTASSNDGNVPANAVDGNLGTRWSASGDGQWIRLDLGALKRVAYVKLAFYNGSARTSTFDVQVSVNGTSWTTVSAGSTSALNNNLQTFDFTDVSSMRYVRIVGHGNSVNAWNSYTEVEVWGQ